MLRRTSLQLAIASLIAGCGGGHATTSITSVPDLGMKRATEARACLIQGGFHILGGPRPPHDANAPDVELIVNDRGPSPFIAFYRRLTRARQLEPMIRERAARIHGASVERRGTVTIFWPASPEPKIRAQIERCAFGP